MFRAFFSALKGVTESLLSLKASVDEANSNFRDNLGLGHKYEDSDKPALGHTENGNGKRKAKVS